MKVKTFLFLVFIAFTQLLHAKTLHVGSGLAYQSIQEAGLFAQPGDRILVHRGLYGIRENMTALMGEEGKPIFIIAEKPGEVIYQGNSEAWHLSSCAHLYINGFVFEQQSANGVNIDDGGQDDASAHHIIVENCIFRDLNANGNNDLLKLSGLYHFEIKHCHFENGAEGGSGIDMVGCHFGEFYANEFENMGSNCIQAKGGSQHLLIRNNVFRDGGQRALNLGGSTGLAYFRPIDASFEAADILVHSNVFIRGWAPIAFVGSVRVQVVNNSIVDPENWVIRILQETVDSSRFESCGDNEFSNNIIYFGNSLHRIVNIGPNTRPESFTFSNNLWYNKEDETFQGPDLPVAETNVLIQQDPLFVDYANGNYDISGESPAIGKGKHLPGIELDFLNRYYFDAPSIGAFESEGIYRDFSAEIGTEWWYRYDLGYSLYRIEDKAAKNGQEISQINNFIHIGDAAGEFEGTEFYERGRQLFIKTRNQDDFYLYYDFNLEKGDTLIANQGNLWSKVDSVDYAYLAGRIRKVLYTSPIKELSSFDLNYGSKGKLIEGIYSVHTKLEGNEYYEDEEYIVYELLRCYVEFDANGDVLYELHFTEEDCDKITLDVQDLAGRFRVFPNPVGDRLKISGLGSVTYNYSLYSFNGDQIVGDALIESDTINIKGLNPGAYVLLIKDSNGYVEIRVKLIKS